MTHTTTPAPARQLPACTLADLEAAYDSLPDRRSLYGQALAEIIRERRAAQEASND